MSQAPPQPNAGSPGRPTLTDIQSFARRYIPFSKRFVANDKDGRGQYITAVFANANTDTSFVIAVGYVPDGYVVEQASVGGVVYNGSNQGTDWTPKKIVLRATIAGTYHVRIK